MISAVIETHKGWHVRLVGATLRASNPFAPFWAQTIEGLTLSRVRADIDATIDALATEASDAREAYANAANYCGAE